MLFFRRSPFYAACLFAGALLVGVAGALHPQLRGDGAAQLATIAATRAWGAIHWSLLFGMPLVVAGLFGVVARHINTAGADPARAGVFLATLGYGVAVINVAFMTGAGATLARAYAAAEAGVGLTATHAVFVFDMLHPFGLVAERVGAFTVSLATYVFGWAVRNGGVYPKWLGWLGVVAGSLGVLTAVAFAAGTPAVLTGLALATVWQVATAVVMLRETVSA